MISEIKTSTITSKGQIVIPSGVRWKKGFHSGQKVVVLAFDDHLEIRPLEFVLKNIKWKEEKKRSRALLKKFAKKHNLKRKKVKKLSQKERNKLAKSLV